MQQINEKIPQNSQSKTNMQQENIAGASNGSPSSVGGQMAIRREVEAAGFSFRKTIAK